MERAQRRSLDCHPCTPQGHVHKLEVCATWNGQAELWLTYVLDARLHELCLPKPAKPQFRDRLWEHTCFEVFVARDGDESYHEWNFSPSGEWAAYAFRRYRERTEWTSPPAPLIQADIANSQLTLRAVVSCGTWLPSPHATLRLALAAVVEDRGGSLAYWSLRHVPGRPDFHRPESFALCLETTSERDAVGQQTVGG